MAWYWLLEPGTFCVIIVNWFRTDLVNSSFLSLTVEKSLGNLNFKFTCKVLSLSGKKGQTKHCEVILRGALLSHNTTTTNYYDSLHNGTGLFPCPSMGSRVPGMNSPLSLTHQQDICTWLHCTGLKSPFSSHSVRWILLEWVADNIRARTSSARALSHSVLAATTMFAWCDTWLFHIIIWWMKPSYTLS